MTPQLRLQRHQVNDLALIRDLDPSHLEAVISHLKSLKAAPLHPDELREALRSVLGSNQEQHITSLVRQMMGLYALIGQLDLKVDDVFAGLLFGIQNSETQWTDEEIQRWKEREPKLRELFSLDSVRLVAKALNLSYEYSNLLRSARILTDVRPVFNEEGNRIDGAVILHTLTLRFDNVEGDHGLSFAMDEGDVKSLKHQCERALLKSKTALTYLTKQAGLRAIVAGKEENGNS